jgi:hypothetical protein
MWAVNTEHGAIGLQALRVAHAALTDSRRPETTPTDGNRSMKKFKVKYLRTKDPAQVCVRGVGGLKLLDVSLPAGTSISVVTPLTPSWKKPKK